MFLYHISGHNKRCRKEEKMKKFIAKEKLSRKAQKALNDEKRIRWEVLPVTRMIPNKKKEAEKKIRPSDTDA